MIVRFPDLCQECFQDKPGSSQAYRLLSIKEDYYVSSGFPAKGVHCFHAGCFVSKCNATATTLSSVCDGIRREQSECLADYSQFAGAYYSAKRCKFFHGQRFRGYQDYG